MGRLLSLKPIVFIGLISYSLYLWHWPVFVFEQTNWLFYLGESRIIEKCVILGVSFVLAVLSWKFIEQPFRGSSWKPRRSIVFATAAIGILAVVASAAATEISDGFPGFNSTVRNNFGAYLKYNSKAVYRSGKCFPYRGENFEDAVKICLPLIAGEKNILILGDSHAQHLRYGLVHLRPHTNYLQATLPGCRPVLESMHDLYPACGQLMTYIVQTFVPRHAAQLDLILLAGDWHDADTDGLIAIALAFRREKIPVLIAGPIAHYNRQLARLLFLEDHLNDHDLHNRYVDKAVFELDAKIEKLAAANHFPYISLARTICPTSKCIARIGNVPVQWDFAHLTAEGSTMVAKTLAPAIEAAER